MLSETDIIKALNMLINSIVAMFGGRVGMPIGLTALLFSSILSLFVENKLHVGTS